MAGKSKARSVLFDPIFNNNPIALQVLGICSALAVTTKLETTLVMCLAVILVVALSSASGQSDPPPDSHEHPHHRADDDHRFAGDSGRPVPAGLSCSTSAGSFRCSWG